MFVRGLNIRMRGLRVAEDASERFNFDLVWTTERKHSEPKGEDYR